MPYEYVIFRKLANFTDFIFMYAYPAFSLFGNRWIDSFFFWPLLEVHPISTLNFVLRIHYKAQSRNELLILVYNNGGTHTKPFPLPHSIRFLQLAPRTVLHMNYPTGTPNTLEVDLPCATICDSCHRFVSRREISRLLTAGMEGEFILRFFPELQDVIHVA